MKDQEKTNEVSPVGTFMSGLSNLDKVYTLFADNYVPRAIKMKGKVDGRENKMQGVGEGATSLLKTIRLAFMGFRYTDSHD